MSTGVYQCQTCGAIGCDEGESCKCHENEKGSAREWTIEEFKEYSSLQFRRYAKRNDLSPDELARFNELSSFYDPLDNRSILIKMYDSAIAERDSLKAEVVEACAARDQWRNTHLEAKEWRKLAEELCERLRLHMRTGGNLNQNELNISSDVIIAYDELSKDEGNI